MAKDRTIREGHDGDLVVIHEQKEALKRPPMYRVVLLNDDFTPMEFVVWLLMTVFHKPRPEAERIMLLVHTSGRGTCGIYPFDVARTKVAQVQSIAKQHGHPLQSVLEAVDDSRD